MLEFLIAEFEIILWILNVLIVFCSLVIYGLCSCLWRLLDFLLCSRVLNLQTCVKVGMLSVAGEFSSC